MILFFFTFFPLPQTSQPVTFPDGSLAQEGSEPCRPRWLVSWVEQGWSEYKSDNQRFSNHLQFSTGCPQVCSIFIGASVNVWPINPMRYLVQLLPISICLKLDIVRRQWYLVWRPHFKLGEERLRAKFIHVFFPWDYHTCIIWKGLWGGQVCGHLPKGVVAEKPDWAAFFFVKAPAECQIQYLRLENFYRWRKLTLGMLRFGRNTGFRDLVCGWCRGRWIGPSEI